MLVRRVWLRQPEKPPVTGAPPRSSVRFGAAHESESVSTWFARGSGKVSLSVGLEKGILSPFPTNSPELLHSPPASTWELSASDKDTPEKPRSNENEGRQLKHDA